MTQVRRDVMGGADALAGHRPIRTCVGCRARDWRVDLLRVVVDVQGRLIPDPGARRHGRGSWVHPTEACVTTAMTRQAFRRALKLTGVPDTTAVRRYVGIDPGSGTPVGADAASVPGNEVDPS